MKAFLAFGFVILVLFGFERHARAGENAVFAILVSNNHSARLSRPDLKYADDDAAKYFEVLRTITPEANVALLTTFDRDTERLFPELVKKTRPATKANLQVAANAFAEKSKAAMAKGTVDFYFVFAGHGDIDRGKGFLELEDGAFNADDLEALLRTFPATRAHVILDSCNSFFVLNSRKPGGQHFVTAEEATKGLHDRLPNVGVFLSTSAEAEVFEWSELQSGIFSHAVRSGLSGAADVNDDGHVSYEELRAFVEIAAKDVKNEKYRPHVYARGPAGRNGDAILDLSASRGKKVRLDGGVLRWTVRDQDDVRWIDVHKEAGSVLTLRVPERLDEKGTVEERDPATGNVLRRYALRSAEETNNLTLAALDSPGGDASSRGPDAMFRALFARPFGPTAFAAFRAEVAAEPSRVLGVSDDERERLRLVLREIADEERKRRRIGGPVLAGIGVLSGVVGGVNLAHGIRHEDGVEATVGGLRIGVGTVLIAFGGVSFFGTSAEERKYEAFSMSLALAADDAAAQRVYADAEAWLLESARKDRVERDTMRPLWAFLLICSSLNLAIEIGDGAKFDDARTLGALIEPVLLSGAFANTFFPTTREKMAQIWKDDPDRLRFGATRTSRVTLRPVFGLTGIGIQGTF